MEAMELRHISIIPLKTKLEVYNTQIENQKALKENSWVDDFQKLKDLYYKQKKNGLSLFTDEIYSEIKDVENRVSRFNKKGFNPEIYLTNEEPQICDNLYDKDRIDKLLMGDVLIYGNPLEDLPHRQTLSKYNIYQLRYLLAHCEPNGKNLLRRFLKGFGPSDSQRLTDSINFYNLQLERQFMECDYSLYDDKLFYANKDLKDEYLEEQIKDIVKYFLSKPNKFVWGSLTDNQKQKMLYSVLSDCNSAKETRKKLIDVISNYTTLNEIQSGLIKTKTIDRFIVR